MADSAGAAWAVARFASLTGRKSWHVVAPGQAQAVLAGFSVASLRLTAETIVTLERLGLKTIGDLEAAPRATLAARFGKALVTSLDRAMGRCREPISPRQPAASVQARVVFAEPIGHIDDVERATQQLIEKACIDLNRLQHGARALVLAVYRVDGKVVTVRVGTSRPVRESQHLMRLFGEHLDKLDLGFGADVMALFVTVSNPLEADQLKLRNQRSNLRVHKSLPRHTAPLKAAPFKGRKDRTNLDDRAPWLAIPTPDQTAHAEAASGGELDSVLSEADVEAAISHLAEPQTDFPQTDFPQADFNKPGLDEPGCSEPVLNGAANAFVSTLTDADVAAAIDRLTDRLGNRLGAENVERFAPHASYLPERSVVAYSPLASPPGAKPSAATVDVEIPWTRGLPRPLSLFLRPEPIDAVAPVPDDPPVLFRWRKQLHRVAWAEGPERMGTEWWREAGLSAMPESLRTRDYFRVEDTSGRRFWLYRNGLYRHGAAAPILVVGDRAAEPEKPHSYGRRQLTAVPKLAAPSGATAVRSAAIPESTPTWFVHGLFA
ncbi:MAG: DNA polymerase Y family protein [Proteobacteria bacterium]|nr:DNA polymerase Y family protein [Pseudomonadota bacterium]